MGWLELGNPREAIEELKQVSRRSEKTPEVMDAWWMIHAHVKDWNAALEVARQYVKTHPDDASGWIHQSYALHEMKQTGDAFDLLSSVATRFPETGVIPYNIACYACQLGDKEQAISWIKRAMKIDGVSKVKARALQDDDLVPIKSDILKI